MTSKPLQTAWIVSLATLLAQPAPAPTERSDLLRVMTFNLRYASSLAPNSWVQRRPVMRRCIEAAAPDVIGTQEGLYPQLKDLAADLPGYAWIGLGREGGSRGEFMAVFYRHDRLDPLEFDHFWLSDTPEVVGSKTWGNSLPRMVTWVRFRDRLTLREFYFFNTHFDHQSQPAREKSAELLRRRIDRLRTSFPVLVVGDFNSPAETSTVYRYLVGPKACTDTWAAAARRGPPIGTFHGFRGPAPGGARIDWILARGPVVADSTEIVTFSADHQYPSDHFPVIATVRLGPAP